MYFSGFWDWIKDVAGDLGLDPDIAAAVARAYASPSPQTIAKVAEAYAARGAIPPPELMQALWQREYESLPAQGYSFPGRIAGAVGDYFPLLAGGLLLILLARRK